VARAAGGCGMKVSELIADLQNVLENEGDIKIGVKDWDFIEFNFGVTVETGQAYIDLMNT
jgi:hypothetical protein